MMFVQHLLSPRASPSPAPPLQGHPDSLPWSACSPSCFLQLEYQGVSAPFAPAIIEASCVARVRTMSSHVPVFLHCPSWQAPVGARLRRGRHIRPVPVGADDAPNPSAATLTFLALARVCVMAVQPNPNHKYGQGHRTKRTQYGAQGRATHGSQRCGVCVGAPHMI
jgi:hypothetical protein